MIHIKRGVYSATSFGCRFLLHVGYWAIYFGKTNRYSPRLELFTPFRWFRFSKGEP